MVRFEYLEPNTLEEASSLLLHHGAEAKILAGGTDLLTRLKRRQWRPRYVINLKRIPGLDQIASENGQGLRIGAFAAIRSLEKSEVVKERFPLLAEASGLLGSVQIRNLATVGGNLCNAAPSADTAPPLIALSASALIFGPGGERVVPLEEFLIGPGTTALRPGEILVGLRVPSLPPGSGGAYIKLSPRGSMDLAIVGGAAVVTLAGEVCLDCRVVVGAVAPTPLRCIDAEAVLRGNPITPELADRAGEAASAQSRPISDVRASAEYRKEMVRVIAKRAVLQAAERAQAR